MTRKLLRLTAVLAALLCAPARANEPGGSADADRLVQQGRVMIMREHPEVLRYMMRKDGFGGPSSAEIARAMLSDDPKLVKVARSAMTIEKHGQGMWLLRFPYVNVALIETRRSLVLFDTGYAAIGPVLAEVIPTISSKPLTHIVVSHVHYDHAYGWKALKAKWPKAKIVTSDLFPAMAAKEVRLGGSIGRLNNQMADLRPKDISALPRPDIQFRDRLDLLIDGERFEFRHAPGETEEQIWMALPSRKAIFTADYYQGFLPNSGNGKRLTRHIDEWIAAFREMTAKKPDLLLPMHSTAITGNGEIARVLSLNADALEHINNQVITRLNAGERPDRIAATLDWPDRFAKAPELDPQYDKAEDIARMVAKRWTGWWDGIPSHFPAMAFETEAAEAVRLAGGIDALDKRARDLLGTQPRLAARLADWAFFGLPDDPKAMQLALDVYLLRLMEDGMPLMESTVYFEHAAQARAKLESLKAKP